MLLFFNPYFFSSAGPVATGGTITTSGSYTIHTFTTSGTFTVLNAALACDILVVAGGGGGGGTYNSTTASGGGGGGFQYFVYQNCVPGPYTVTVGTGGAGGTGATPTGTIGINSKFGTLAASVGGGFGTFGDPPKVGGDGGSGGGGASGSTSGAAGSLGGNGTSGQGFNGGQAWNGTYYGSGGGGGAGGAGSPGSSTVGGSGGAGISNSINGTLTYYAGGGGGGTALSGGTSGTGGLGGGGNAGNGGTWNAGFPGTPNTGGGGGGASGGTGTGSANGGAGGSGIVIVRYLVGPDYTTSGLLNYYDFSKNWGSGTTVNDLAGSVQLTINSSAGSSIETSPPALYCSSSSFTTYLQNTNPYTTISSLTATTIEVLFKPASTSGAQYTVNLGYGVSGGLLCMNGVYNCFQNPGQNITITTGSTVNTTAWSHVVFVFTGGGASKIFLNGVSQAITTTGTITTPFSFTRMNFGMASQGIYGRFAMARIYNRALSDAEILVNYASAKAAGSYGI